MQAGAATAVAAPLLRPSKAEAEFVKAGKINKAENGGGKAPVLVLARSGAGVGVRRCFCAPVTVFMWLAGADYHHL